MNEPMKFEIVRLAGDGANWVSYRDRMGVILRMRRWHEHLTSATVSQAYINRGDVNGIAPAMRWEDDDEAVKALIMSSIPDELFNWIKSGVNAQAWWDSLKNICEDRSRSMSIDLRGKLQSTHCGEDDDVRAHFAKLTNYREQLAAMGQSIPDQQFADILIASLPSCYEMRLCAITTNADETGNPIRPARIVKFISDDYDKWMISKEAEKKSDDQAFAAQSRKRKNKSDIKCFNCKKKGHIKAECWAKGGGKEGQGPRRNRRGQESASESAASAAEKTEDIESWILQVHDDLSFESLISSSSAGSEISEVSSDTDVESWASIGEADFADSESGSDDAKATDTYAQDAVSAIEGNAEAELYDSGASRHISPFQHRFVTYQPITPRPISAADN
jgi:gag-polypeptide of LTR copia-type